jgi:hypothetical protein
VSLQQNAQALDAIAFAEKFVTLLNEGSYTTTYKFAVLLGLMDLVIEGANKEGSLATTITTNQLANKIIEIYWNHVTNYEAINGVAFQGKAGQAEVVRDILKFREKTNFVSFFKAKNLFQKEYKSLTNLVEKKVIEMPLPRVQYFGNQENRFIYDIDWSRSTPQDLKQVTAYQGSKESEFDNRINLLPNVADYLVNLNGLLRPMVQHKWAMEVAKINKLEESKLEKFLFGSQRGAIAKFSEPLRELQNNQCFYCEDKFTSRTNKKPAVDHFIPWARVPNDGLANLVLAHSDCNGSKSDHIAAVEHLEHWLERNQNQKQISELSIIADESNWDLRKDESESIAKTMYCRLLPNVELWRAKGDFILYESRKIEDSK